MTYGYTGPAGQGRDFAPGYDLRTTRTIIAAAFPTANIVVADGVQSPTVHEFTLGLGREVGNRGYAKATYQWRRWYGFLDDFIALSNGIVNVNRNGAEIGDLTKVRLRQLEPKGRSSRVPGDDLPEQLSLARQHHFGGHYTLQIATTATSTPKLRTSLGSHPSTATIPRSSDLPSSATSPSGRLADYQRHKLRLYGTYTLGSNMGRLGALDVSPIWRVNSAQVYSIFADGVPLTPIELARNPGYPVNDINAEHADGSSSDRAESATSKATACSTSPSPTAFPSGRVATPWLKVEFYNLLNNQKQIAWDKTVTPDNNGPKDAQRIPLNYSQGPTVRQGDQRQPVPAADSRPERRPAVPDGARPSL